MMCSLPFWSNYLTESLLLQPWAGESLEGLKVLSGLGQGRGDSFFGVIL